MDNQIKEFFRYIIVGGTAFIVDAGLLYVLYNCIFYTFAEKGVYISVAISFIGGLIVNYILCLLFVFKIAKEENKGKSISSFMTFSVIGLIGLLLTEFGMYIGLDIFRSNYLIVKVLVAGLILIWNYGARKLIIFS